MEYIKRTVCILLVFLLAGCGYKPADSTEAAQNTSVQYFLDYYYCIKEDGYVSEATRQALNGFGQSKYFVPAEGETESFTQIPEGSAKAQGWINLVFPEADPGDYVASPKKTVGTDGTAMVTCYRTVGGMTTDEAVNIYMDAEENVQKYDTVNAGKYDTLIADETAFANVRTTFMSAARRMPGLSGVEYHAPVDGQTDCRIFTDAQGNLLILP